MSRDQSRHDELAGLEQAAIDAELETSPRDESVEQAKRHLLVRLARMGVGSVLVLVGLTLLVLPGPGLVTIAAGLALLSRDVPFARRLLDRVRARLPEGEDGEVSTRFVVASVVVAVATVSASVWWTLLR